MSATPHPFPPLVRWAVFPALAAVAGAAGGGSAGYLSGNPGDAPEMAGMAGALSAGAALAAALSVRPWIALLLGPALGILVLCGGYAAFNRLAREGVHDDAWRLLLEILRNPSMLLIFGGTLWLQAAAHVRELRPGRIASPLRRSLSFLVAAAISFSFVGVAASSAKPVQIGAFTFLGTALQAFPLLACLALAKRFRSATVH